MLCPYLWVVWRKKRSHKQLQEALFHHLWLHSTHGRIPHWLVQVTHIVPLWEEYWRFGPGISSDRVLGWEWIKGKDWRASDTLRCKEIDTCCSTTFLITDYSIIQKALGPSRLAHTLGSIATTAGYSDRHEGRWEGQNGGLVQWYRQTNRQTRSICIHTWDNDMAVDVPWCALVQWLASEVKKQECENG